jgi:hypothetical protein
MEIMELKGRLVLAVTKIALIAPQASHFFMVRVESGTLEGFPMLVLHPQFSIFPVCQAGTSQAISVHAFAPLPVSS